MLIRTSLGLFAVLFASNAFAQGVLVEGIQQDLNNASAAVAAAAAAAITKRIQATSYVQATKGDPLRRENGDSVIDASVLIDEISKVRPLYQGVGEKDGAPVYARLLAWFAPDGSLKTQLDFGRAFRLFGAMTADPSLRLGADPAGKTIQVLSNRSRADIGKRIYRPLPR
jgi:hypothetical protein